MITIYARKDLGYRRGKMAAQSAHALMKLVLESFHEQNGQLLCSIEAHSQLQLLAHNPEFVKIEWVENAERIYELEAKHGLYASTIIDSGKTESAGVPTLTCLAVDHSETFKRTRTVQFEKNLYNCKQVLVMRTDLKLSKEEQMAAAAQASCKVVTNALKSLPAAGFSIDLEAEENYLLNAWLKGAFAKIGVKGQSLESIETVISAADAAMLHTSTLSKNNEIIALAVGPGTAEMHEGVTDTLKLY